MSTQPLDIASCPDCGATNDRTLGRCWLCGKAFGGQTATPAAASPYASPGRPPAVPPLPTAAAPASPFRPGAPYAATQAASPRAAWTVGLSTLFIVVTLFAVGFGLYAQEEGLGILYAVVMTPALVATTVRSVRRQATGQPLTGGQKVLTFFLWAAVTAAAIPILAIVACVAFFLYCLASMN